MKKLLEFLDVFFDNTVFPWIEKATWEFGLQTNPWLAGLGFSIGLVAPFVVENLLAL